MMPLVVYDDRCAPCTSFAGAVGALARGRLPLVGHHTELGRRLRAGLLGGDAALDMFWVVDGDVAYGGRAALLPLLRAVWSCRSRPHAGALAAPAAGGGGCAPAGRGVGCDGQAAVFARSASLFTRGRTVATRGARDGAPAGAAGGPPG